MGMTGWVMWQTKVWNYLQTRLKMDRSAKKQYFGPDLKTLWGNMYL